jgi:hypothetical protein
MAPRVFPLVCAVSVMLFYLIGYSSISMQAPPAAVIATAIERAAPMDVVDRRGLQALALTSSAVAATVPIEASPPARTGLVLDGSLEAALRYAVPPGKPKFLLVTFGNLGVKDQLLNFVAHVKRAGAQHVVGAVDVGAFDLMLAQGSPAYKTPLASEAYQMDGSNQHASSSWKKFAGMRTGEVMKIVAAGYTVMHTDCDVVWLRDPMPYAMCETAGWNRDAPSVAERYPCEPLREADVMVSSDNMSPDKDAQAHASYAAGGTFNTGLLLIRSSLGGVRFVKEWHRLVVSPDRGSRFAALTSDQQVFNHMMRKPNEWPGISAPHGAWVMDAWDKTLRLGALAMPLFMNGHGYFVQRAHVRLGFTPLAVHATYSLDNHDNVAKRQRFREAGLWEADDDAYYGKGRGYLALNGTLSPALQAKIKEFVSKGMPPTNIGVHALALAEYVNELRDALALATILKRTLILPRWACYCDRLWSGSDDIFSSGCMYNGAEMGKFVPFTCPMDHVLSPAAWERVGLPYRDPSFLSSPRRPKGPVVEINLLPRAQWDKFKKDAKPVELSTAATASGKAAANPTFLEPGDTLPLGATAEEAREALSKLDAPVLILPHARGVLCEAGTSAEVSHINSLASQLLRVPQWCAKCYQPCASELSKWLSPEQLQRGVHGSNYYCLDVALPPAFREGQCVLNGDYSTSN